MDVRDAPADEHAYEVVTDTALDPGRWRLAVRGRTEWTVRSAAAPEDHPVLLPLINLGYGHPQAAAAIAAAARNAGEGADTATLIRQGLKELAR